MSGVLPVIGAVGGFIVGGPQGAAIGFSLGSAIGGMFGGGQTVRLPTVEGPRLSDLRVQTSNYGKVIPEVYGQARLAGNVIWARPIKEVRVETTTTTSQRGGKGGGGGGGKTSQSQVSYEYFATLAISISEGPIDEVVRVYADAKILDDSLLQASQGKYNVYLGTESQLPDPIMEGFEGAGNVPAYRGTAYIVIQDFPLAAFGNRIPNFTFEVKRNVRFYPAVEDKIKDVVMIPGAGEFVYSPSIVYKQNTEIAGAQVVASGPQVPLNMHNFEATANVNVAVDQLLKTFPNLEWVALVVSWFATSTDAGTCTIIPKVENPASTTTFTPVDWAVAGLTRATAQQVLQFGDGSPTYGGTPSDKSVLDLCVKLKALGIKVLFYPMVFVDQITPTPKPWRGRIAPANATDCNNWFTKTNGYNAFVNWYANLNIGGVYLKNNIDAFLIGSELIGMTSFTPSAGSYPAVSQLVSLAASVKTAVGAGVKVSYAADWSEYHSQGGWFNLDPLWASPNIDFVGIDCYFPLTPDLPQTQITEDVVKQYWESGEGWDYYFTDSVNRTGQTNYANQVYAWKNVEYWWKNTHTNPNAVTTAWTVKMKPIWFTEMGFPSVDGCTNQPNVFYDPSSSESFFPRASKGRVDFMAQRTALNASLDFLETRRLLSGNTDLVQRRFIWTWDARPFPFWPDLSNFWADWQLWKTGHWVNGKLGTSTLGAVIAVLLKKAGLEDTDFDVTRLTQQLDGYVILQVLSCRERIEQLQSMFNFDAVETDGIIKFVPRGGQSIANITQDELVTNSSGGSIREEVEITRKQELDLPQQVNITYISRTANYDPGTQMSQRQTVNAVDSVGINVPVVSTDQYAKTVADITLYNAWVSRVGFKFTLPAKYCLIEPTDILTLAIDGVNYVMRVSTTKIERTGLMEVTAVAEDVSTYDFYTPPGETPPIAQPGTIIPNTRLELLDLPALPNDTEGVGILRAATVSQGENWEGSVIYRSDDGGQAGGNTFAVMSSTDTEHTVGGALTLLAPYSSNSWDYANTVDVLLQFGTLSSISELGVLNGGNVALLGNEVIQFQNAQLLADKKYRLSKLLRGRLGTEHEVGTHALAERFVLLSSNLVRVAVQNSIIGLARHYKPVSVGGSLATTVEQVFTYTGKTLRPYSPVNIKGTRNLPATNDWTITWVRRTRLGGDWRDGVDVPLSEQSELYHVQIMNGLTVVRTVEGITTPSLVYTAAQQVVDFGAVQSSFVVKVYQISAIIGRGVSGQATIS